MHQRLASIALALALVIPSCASDEVATPPQATDGSAVDVGGGGSKDTVPSDADSAAETVASDAGTGTDSQPTTLRYTEERQACADRNPLRNLYFGDLHVHTAYSFDAFSYDVRTTPDDAYAFATGATVALPPLGPDGKGTRLVKLSRPLDFAAVTDHAELLAETSLCTTEDSPAKDSSTCKAYPGTDGSGTSLLGIELSDPDPTRLTDVCGEDGAMCANAIPSIWSDIQAAAEGFYDRSSACTFTTFVAYEYTGSPNLSNIHRNVIFRNAVAPETPTTYFEEPTEQGLWAALRAQCTEKDDACDALAIPHNPNWSNGRMFTVEYPGAKTPEEEAQMAAQRAEMEPLMEIFQHKGDSECSNGLSGTDAPPDPLCDFEKLRLPPFEDCGDTVGQGAMIGLGCISRLDYLRPILLEGMREESRIGENPYRLGVIASTDTHNGTPGAVDEEGFRGHVGMQDYEPDKLLGVSLLLPGGITNNPGGLAAVWAEENSRDSLFGALRRRETFGTSGPRISVRLFAGWSYPSDLCGDPALVEKGYAGGVPMGGILRPGEQDGGAPVLVVSAMRDPGTPELPGGLLQRVQVVKGWVDADGKGHELVYDVAGDKDNGATVDPETCTPQGPGSDTLCAVFQDPAFDPARRAFYYVRVVENPSCRYSARVCLTLPPAERPPACEDPAIARLIQERAWTSPIWYEPGE